MHMVFKRFNIKVSSGGKGWRQGKARGAIDPVGR